MKQEDMKKRMDAYAIDAERDKDSCLNEAQTKRWLIEPYMKLLGYDVHNRHHMDVEYRADIHTGQEKVDYVVLNDGKPWLAIEAKSAIRLLISDAPTAQVRRYAMSLDHTSFLAYTNGVVWRWFKKGSGSNQLEEKPFLEHDVSKPENREVEWLTAIHNSNFDVKNVKDIANREYLCSDFTNWFRDCQANPSDGFLKFILKNTGHSATRKMLESARVAWKRVVRNSEAAQLNEASRRLRGETGDQSEPQDAPKRETVKAQRTKGDAPSKKLKSFRWRYGADDVWHYESNGRATQKVVTKHYFDTASDSADLHDLFKPLNTKYRRDGLRKEMVRLLESGSRVPKFFNALGTNPEIIVYCNLSAAAHMVFFIRLMRAAPDFEIETDQGEGNNDVDQAEWPWVSVATLVKPSINEDE